MRNNRLIGKTRPGAEWILAAAAFLLAVTVSVVALTLKRDALQFHPRDYNYFIEMAARLGDPGLTDRYSTNIEGFNLFGLQGIEGVKSIYHAIHTEYYRWVNVLLYALFQDILPIYLLFSLLYFAPVLYAVWVRRRAGGARWAVVLFILLYILFPGAVPAVAGDFRSRMLYSSAWSLALIAVYFDRPWGEKLVSLAFLPFIREDGILLGAIVTALNFIRMRGKPERGIQTLLFVLVLAAALAAFIGFMAWGGYNRIDNVYNPLNILARVAASPAVWGLALLVVAGLARLAARRAVRSSPAAVQALLFWVVYSTVIALAALQLSRDFAGWYAQAASLGALTGLDIYLKIITWEQTSLLYSALILPVFLVGSGVRGAQRGVLLVGATLLCTALALTTLFTLPAKMVAWQQQAGPARLVWDFKHGHDRYRTRLLVDFPVLQAFYDYETVVVYNRLPVWMVYPNLAERFYPQNKVLVARAIAGGLEYAVITRESLDNVRELAQMAGRALVEVQSNERFIVLRFQ